MELDVEVWKDVVGYEGLYQVSSWGNLKSIKFGRELLLKPTISGNRYIVINLNRKTFNVHIIVAMAFHGHIPCGHDVVVDHKDNNPLNNRADNLKLTTHRDNSTKDRKGGSSQFTGVHWCKLSNKWRASIDFKGYCVRLGFFELEIDAHYAYQKALKQINDGVDLMLLYPIKRVKTSIHEGVGWNKDRQRWYAKYKGKFLGYFETEQEAYEVREKYILQLQEKVIILS